MAEPRTTGEADRRLRMAVRGAVQGVGFRPFVYRLATGLGLCGWVSNSCAGVSIELEGAEAALSLFQDRLRGEAPPLARITGCEAVWLDPVGHDHFSIRESDHQGPSTALVLPDIAVCRECLDEVLDPGNRRHRYPFTNCTHCGPRFSIIQALPYDRVNTSMRRFAMCPACREEYEDPADRRFHAQPNACHVCGPRLELWDRGGRVLATHDDALREAGRAVRDGRIVAVKGLGGFHLLAAAGDGAAVAELRARKHREEKPLAIMVASIDAARLLCHLHPAEERLLGSPEAPIVLLRRRDGAGVQAVVAREVAPGNPYLGVVLPYTPLHHLLIREIASPVVATSGNASDEPICTDEREALVRLADVADLFLVHDRPIVRPVDDSVAIVVADRDMILRRARGYAPLPIPMPRTEVTVLAVGAQQKSTVAIGAGDGVTLSQHLGDLVTPEAFAGLRRACRDLPGLCGTAPLILACDYHPDYLSTKLARDLVARSAEATALRPTPIEVQHHHAHVVSCMAENELDGEVLGIAWDGTGLGPDGTIWGGEFLRSTLEGFARVAHLRTFALPGGERAAHEPWRSAIGVLYELFGRRLGELVFLAPVRDLPPSDRLLVIESLVRGVNAPRTSSAGRLFDSVASLVDLRQHVRHEGQAAMELEWRALAAHSESAYAFDLWARGPGDDCAVVDWEPTLRGVLHDVRRGVRAALIAARFHRALAEMMVGVAKRQGLERVVLSGGCFQNRLLLELAIERLRDEGFRPYWHQRVPTNDGGIALGQAVVAAVRLRHERAAAAGGRLRR